MPSEQPESELLFFLVQRTFVENSQNLVTEALDQAHKDHVAEHSNSVVSFRRLTREGDTPGVASIKAYKSWEEVERYVYDDPFTKAGMFAEISIDQIDMYVLNAMYARAPEWYKKQFPERAPAYTTPKS